VDGTGIGSCPVAGFGISGVEPWGSAIFACYFQLFFHSSSSFRLCFNSVASRVLSITK
jgi:hypothetical protein